MVTLINATFVDGRLTYLGIAKVSGSRDYASGDVKALFLLSRGYCYEPTCKAPVLVTKKGRRHVNVQIAHVRALNDGGARYDRKMTHQQRNSFSNLMLLCKPDHDEIDGVDTRDQYSVDLLRQWKADREGNLAEQLEGLSGLTPERLEELMVSSVGEAKSEVLTAIDALAEVSKGTADMLRALVNETFERPYLDPDMVTSLEYSARNLAHLQDHAWMLHESAELLKGLPDNIWMLHESAELLKGLPDNIWMLHESAELLKGLPDQTSTLYRSAELFEGFGWKIEMLHTAAEQIERARLGDVADRFDRVETAADRLSGASSSLAGLTGTVQAIEQATEHLAFAASATRAGGDWSWRAFRWGMGACFAAVVALLLAYTYAAK